MRGLHNQQQQLAALFPAALGGEEKPNHPSPSSAGQKGAVNYTPVTYLRSRSDLMKERVRLKETELQKPESSQSQHCAAADNVISVADLPESSSMAARSFCSAPHGNVSLVNGIKAPNKCTVSSAPGLREIPCPMNTKSSELTSSKLELFSIDDELKYMEHAVDLNSSLSGNDDERLLSISKLDFPSISCPLGTSDFVSLKQTSATMDRAAHLSSQLIPHRLWKC